MDGCTAIRRSVETKMLSTGLGLDDRSPVAQNRRRDLDHHRRRPQAPRRPHWTHGRAPHLGVDTHPPSACPHHRPGRRRLSRWRPLDRLPARLFPPRSGPLPALPSPVPRRAERPLPDRAIAVLPVHAALYPPASFYTFL